MVNIVSRNMKTILLVICWLYIVAVTDAFSICDIVPWSGTMCKKIADCDNQSMFMQVMMCGFVGNIIKVCCASNEPGKEKLHPLVRNPENCGSILWTKGLPKDGQPTEADEFPWLALLEHETDAGTTFSCGGVLINERYVLTAAHCLHSSLPLTGVRLGEYNLTSERDCVFDGETTVCKDPVIIAGIEEKIVHENYVFSEKPNENAQPHDIALIRLDRYIPTNQIKPICLPDEEITKTGKYLSAGWGVMPQKQDMMHNVKTLGRYIKVDKESCNQKHGKVLHNNIMCTTSKSTKLSCLGDSGGPLMSIDKRSKMMVVGILSDAAALCKNITIPSTYTDVHQYVDWINAKMHD